MAKHPMATVLVLSGALLSLGACSSRLDAGAESAPDGTAVQLEVERTVERFFELSERRDWKGVGALMAPGFEIYTDGAASFPRDEYIELLESDDLVVESWELRDLETSVSPDGRMAWCRYRGRFLMTSQGERHDVETAETLVFERRDGAWKIVQAHASIKSL